MCGTCVWWRDTYGRYTEREKRERERGNQIQPRQKRRRVEPKREVCAVEKRERECSAKCSVC